MSREFKPGDVAMVSIHRGEGVFDNVRAIRERGGWQTGSEWVGSAVGEVTHARPLVVIDPSAIPHLSDFDEDAARALSRIADDVAEVGGGDLDATEEIIRWLADQMPKPPKPEEPTGKWAVIEDAAGRCLIRSAWSASDRPWNILGTGDYLDYADIAVVRILSGGVA